MRVVRPVAAAVAAVCLLVWPASAKLLIEIDKSAQRMTVSQDGARLYTWPVSTGQRGYDTPGGEFTPFRMEKEHYSREWDDAPMPHSIFFTKRGHAIHGTEHLRNIGRPASHGCVRLEPENARVLFGLVRQEGMTNVRVVLFGPTGPGAPAVARRAPQSQPRYVNDDEDSTPPRRVERRAVYRSPLYQPPVYQSPFGGPQPDYYQRGYRAPQYIGPGNPYGWD
jgi:hypothetical protein